MNSPVMPPPDSAALVTEAHQAKKPITTFQATGGNSHVNATHTHNAKVAPGAAKAPGADLGMLLPPIQFAACELGVALTALRRCGKDARLAREDRNNSVMLAHVVETHFEAVLQVAKPELFHLLGLQTPDQVTFDEAVPELPENCTRQDVIDGIREIHQLAMAARRLEDPAFRRWPTMDAILDHVEKHGLGPKEGV